MFQGEIEVKNEAVLDPVRVLSFVIRWLHAGILPEAKNICGVKRICGKTCAQHRGLEAFSMGIGNCQIFLSLGPHISFDNTDAEIQLCTTEARAALDMMACVGKSSVSIFMGQGETIAERRY